MWTLLHPRMTEDMLGYLPSFLSEHDPRPAKEQIHENYQHGGGWNPMQGWTLGPANTLTYPGDPPLPPIAKYRLREELILLYPSSWLAIVQPDRSFEVARVD